MCINIKSCSNCNKVSGFQKLQNYNWNKMSNISNICVVKYNDKSQLLLGQNVRRISDDNECSGEWVKQSKISSFHISTKTMSHFATKLNWSCRIIRVVKTLLDKIDHQAQQSFQKKNQDYL